MSLKNVMSPHETETHYDDSFVRRLRNVDDLKIAHSTGSKNRLKNYRKNLCVSRGTEKPLFDNGLKDLLEQYVYDARGFEAQLSYLNALKDQQGYSFSRDLKIYSSTQAAMERFAELDHPSFRWNRNYIRSLKSLIDEVSSFKLRPQRYGSDDDILSALPKTDTHSGSYYLETGKRSKGENVVGLQAQYIDRKKHIRNGSEEHYPILIAFRTQASGEYSDDGEQTGTCKHKTRVVSMYDLRDIVIELQFSNPVQKKINQMEWYAGGKDDRQISMIIHDFSARYAKFMSIDYSSFDQTISSWLIEDAFKVIKAMFVLSEQEEKELDFVCQNFIHKDFILNEGVLHSDKGVPSGSMFTQIIDSIVNILVVRTYFYSINKPCKMIAMGDDNAIFTVDGISLSQLASYIIKNFGLVVKVDEKSNEGYTRRQDVKFLSRFWTNSGPWRHPNQLISRMLFPERWRDYTGDIHPEHVLFSYCLTYPKGMRELMNVPKFMREHPISTSYVLNNVDSRYVPGSLSYRREYVGVSS